MCLSLLPWIVEYIVLYHHLPWGCSFVSIKLASFFLLNTLLRARFSFHTTLKNSVSRFNDLVVNLNFSRSKANQKQKVSRRAVWNVSVQHLLAPPQPFLDLYSQYVSQMNEPEWNEDLLSFSFHKNQRIATIPSKFLKHRVLMWC